MFGNFQVGIYMITHPLCTDKAIRFFRLLATLINVRIVGIQRTQRMMSI